MQETIIAVEDENFRFPTTDETDDLKDDSHVSSVNNGDDVLVGRTWCKWYGEYLTPEELEEKEKNSKVIEEELKQKSIERLKAEKIVETPVQPEPPKRREATLNNPSGHEWFNGTSWGVK
jgi:hypothetical protein